jgi:hypothetical protein
MSGRVSAFGLAASLLVFVALALWVGPVPTQDAFITYDYARHVAAGDGFVFNVGDPATEGYSSFLWVLICAAMFDVHVDPAVAAPDMSLFCGALCVVLLWVLLRRRATEWHLWLTSLLFFASAAPIIVASMTGADATLFALLLLSCVWGLDRLAEQPTTAKAVLLALTGILTILCRFEGIVAAITLVAVLVRYHRKGGPQSDQRPLAVAGVLVLVLVAYHGWRAMTFGQALPDSLLVRLGVNAGVYHWVRPYDIIPFGMYYLIAGVITAAAFALSKRTPGERFGVTVALLLGLLYLVIRDPTPGLSNHASLLALAVILWPRAHRAIIGTDTKSSPRAHRQGAYAMIAALVLLGTAHVADNRVAVQRIQESREKTLEPLGRWLATWRPDLTLAAGEPGTITYYARGRCLDLRDRSRLGSIESNRSRALATANPDVVLLGSDGIMRAKYDPGAEPLLLALRQRYRVLAAIRTAWSHDRTVVVHIRRDIPELTDEVRDTFPDGIGSIVRVNR